MVNHIVVSPTLPEAWRMLSCDLCGDDLGVHEWVDVDSEWDVVVACDRNEGE